MVCRDLDELEASLRRMLTGDAGVVATDIGPYEIKA